MMPRRSAPTTKCDAAVVRGFGTTKDCFMMSRHCALRLRHSGASLASSSKRSWKVAASAAAGMAVWVLLASAAVAAPLAPPTPAPTFFSASSSRTSGRRRTSSTRQSQLPQLPIPSSLMPSSPALTTNPALLSSLSTSFDDPSGVPTHHRIAVVVSTRRDSGRSSAYSFANDEYKDGKRGGRHQRRRKAGARSSSSSSSLFSPLSLVGAFVRSTFLPTGYPDRIPPGYLNYVVHSVLQDLSTQLRSVLATQRILRGVGVGQPHATALSALLQFLLRDGCGMAGSLVFTSLFASQFRNDVKRWRLLADLVLDVGMTLEVAALSVPPEFFVPMICAGNVCKAICGVAAGATGGAIALHWAGGGSGRTYHRDDRREDRTYVDIDGDEDSTLSRTRASGTGSDISDIQAKFAAQNTVTGSLGLLAAAWFAKTLSDVDSARLWGWYAILTFVHLYANARCMRLIHLDYLNTERLRRVANDFLSKFSGPTISTSAASTTSTSTPSVLPWPAAVSTSMLFLPNPQQVAQQEPLWFVSPSSLLVHQGVKIRYGVRFDQFVKASKWSEDDLIAALAVDDSYVVALDKRSRRPKSVVVAVMGSATTLQRTKAYFHGLLLKRRLGELVSSSSTSQSSTVDFAESLRNVERIVQREMDDGHTWRVFCKECYRAGWDLKRSELKSEGYEVAVQYRRT